MEIEDRLVAACIEDTGVISKVRAAGVKPKHLESDKNSYLLDAVLKLDDIGDVSVDVIDDYIFSDDSLESEKKEALSTRVDNLSSKDLSGVNFSIKKISEVAKKKEVVELLNNVTEDFGNRDIDEILQDVGKKVRVIQSSESDYDLHDYMESFPEREVERSKLEEDSEENLSIGLNLYPFKDPYFKKGILPKQTTAIGGPTYAGKSVALINFVRLAAHPINGFNVLYVVSENRRIEAASRLDAAVLGKEYDELYESDLDREGQSFFADALDDGWGKIFLSKVKINNFDAATIETMINDVKSKTGREIDVLAIDSPDHQNPIDNMREWWRRKGKVYADNKKLAEDYNLINLTTLPLQRDSVGSTVGNEDTAGDYNIAKLADNLIFYEFSMADRKLSRGKLKVTKARDGEVDNELLYFYFEDNMRLIPWDDAFGGAISPDGDEDESSSDLKFRIEKFKKSKEVEQQGNGLNRKV